MNQGTKESPEESRSSETNILMSGLASRWAAAEGCLLFPLWLLCCALGLGFGFLTVYLCVRTNTRSTQEPVGDTDSQDLPQMGFSSECILTRTPADVCVRMCSRVFV